MHRPRVSARPEAMIGNFHRLSAYAGRVPLPIPVQRLGYRTAYRVLRVYWWIFRPRSSGVKCILTHQDAVLLVRHTYGPRGWDLPGGSRKRGEAAEATATREIQEELGLSVDAWRPLGKIEVVIDRHTDALHCFHAEVGSPEIGSPPLVLDLAELSAAQWFPKQSLPHPLGRYTSAILARLDSLT